LPPSLYIFWACATKLPVIKASWKAKKIFFMTNTCIMCYKIKNA
jgi:hypothetical protein